MSTGITRKRFLLSLFGSTAAVLLDGCGGGGSSYSSPMPPPPPAPAPAATCSDTAISGNHGHSLSFAKTDTDSLSAKMYSIMGAAAHDHSVTLSTSQLAQLKAGTPVTVTSSAFTDGHTHDVTITCT